MGLLIAVASVLALVAAAGAPPPSIATALVDSQFPGYSGVALSSACLAYLGDGAIAAGGAGTVGVSVVIVGDAAI